MMKKRISYHLTVLQGELKRRALNAQDDETRSEYWKLYFRARNAEHEVRAMVMDAEMRRLLEFVFPNGVPNEPPPATSAATDSSTEDSEPPPMQRGLWD